MELIFKKDFTISDKYIIFARLNNGEPSLFVMDVTEVVYDEINNRLMGYANEEQVIFNQRIDDISSVTLDDTSCFFGLEVLKSKADTITFK